MFKSAFISLCFARAGIYNNDPCFPRDINLICINENIRVIFFFAGIKDGIYTEREKCWNEFIMDAERDLVHRSSLSLNFQTFFFLSRFFKNQLRESFSSSTQLRINGFAERLINRKSNQCKFNVWFAINAIAADRPIWTHCVTAPYTR